MSQPAGIHSAEASIPVSLPGEGTYCACVLTVFAVRHTVAWRGCHPSQAQAIFCGWGRDGRGGVLEQGS